MTVLNYLRRICSASGLPDKLFLRLYAVFFAASALEIRLARLRGIDPIADWKEFVGGVNILVVLFFAALGFIILSELFRIYEDSDSAALIVSSVWFACEAVTKSGSFYFAMGAGAAAAVFSCYALSKTGSRPKISSKLCAALIALTAAGAFLFVGLTSVYKHKAFGTPCFDMGIFVQTFHELKTSFSAVITCERGEPLSHFYVHGSYIFWLFLPIYALFPYAETLLWAQPLFAVAGAIPLWLILKGRGFGNAAKTGFCAVYLLAPALLMPCYFSFHENAFLPALLMWLLYAVDRKNIPLMYIMSALVCIVKEDAPLYVLCICLYFLSEERSKKRPHGLICAALASVYFVIVMHRLLKYGEGEYMTSSRLGILMDSPDSGMIGIILNVIKDPARFFSLFFTENTLLFVVETLLPLMALPLMSTRLNRYLLVIPYVIMCLVIGSNYRYAADIGFQYIPGPYCLLIYLSAINYENLGKGRRYALLSAAIFSLVSIVALASPKIDYIKDYREGKEGFSSSEEVLKAIPEDASVLANTFILPHVAQRKEVYELTEGLLKEGFSAENFDCYALSVNDPLTPAVEEIISAAGYQRVARSKGFTVIWAKNAPAGVETD